MIYPQVLLISQNSRTRRLYHRLLGSLECELHTAQSVSDALVRLASGNADVIVFEQDLPAFEVSTFFEVIEQKPAWSSIPIIAVGYETLGHLFPKRTQFAATSESVASLLSELLRTL